MVDIEWGESLSPWPWRAGPGHPIEILYEVNGEVMQNLLEPVSLHGLPFEMDIRGPDGNTYRGPVFILKREGFLPPPIIEWKWRARDNLDRDLIERRVNNVILRLSDEMGIIYLKRVEIIVAKDHGEVFSTLPGAADRPVTLDPKVIYSYFRYDLPKSLTLSATPEGLTRRPEWVDENVAHEVCEFAVAVEAPYSWTTPKLPPELHDALTSSRIQGEKLVEHVVRERLANLDVVRMGYGKEELEVLVDELDTILRGFVGKPPAPYYLVALLGGDKSFSLKLAGHPNAERAWQTYRARLGELNPELSRAYEEFRGKVAGRASREDFSQRLLLKAVEELLRQ